MVDPEILKNLSPKQRELLRLRLRQAPPAARRKPEAVAIEPERIPRQPRGAGGSGTFPASFAQERFWFLDRLEPGSTAYNIPAALAMRGDLDIPVLAASLGEIVRRHESLRTTFSGLEGESPVQRVHPPGNAGNAELALPLVDLSGLPPGRLEAASRQGIAAAVDRPFDLEQGPLIRVVLVRHGAREHVAVLTVHHIASDGWSSGVLVRELGALYRAVSRREPSPLPVLPVQYADFAVWQRGWLRGEALDRKIAYWRERLAGVAPLELPTDRRRPPVQGHRGAVVAFTLPRDLAEAAAALGRRQGATFYMTLLAAFTVLLHRLSGQDDLTVGTPHACRDRREVEGLIGPFINTLTLRADLAGAPVFTAVLESLRAETLRAFAHRDVPFEKVVESLRPDRSLSVPPLFQVLFNLASTGLESLSLPGLTLSPHPYDANTAKLDLSLSLDDSAEGLTGALEYATDLFDDATIRRFRGHFETLLAGVAADPGRRVSDLPLLSAAERRQLLEDGNGTAAARPAGALVHELFAARAALHPEAPAVAQGEEVLTYGALAARANRLARHLRRLGVGVDPGVPEVRVALCLERTPDLVVGLLGVLGAGGAYVPLDPAHPAERTGLVLADAAPAVLVTEERWLAVLPPTAARVVCLDRDRAAIAAEGAEAPERTVDEESLAYVLFTSGSTGRPKGVELPHRAVVNFLLAMARRPGLGARDVVPALTTITFDIAGLEIYLPLAVGGRVEMVSREEAADGRLLAARLAACGATLAQATPATWRMLLEAGWPGDPALTALCGGEALPRDLAAALGAKVGALWNVYGPTETAIWSTAGPVAAGAGPVPLGAPLANTRLYVVDRNGEPVPPGVAGELWIAGDGVARGYRGRPDLTAEKFVPDPFPAAPGTRLYRTGDLVRRRSGGSLEFLGRLDHQVKIRGFRIELGEIEAVLDRHPGVRESRVLVREIAADGTGMAGDRQLVAYFLPAGQEAAEPALREHLGGHLPEHMLPAAFVAVPAWPLTPNGKLDLKALPAPERRGGDAAAEPPRTATETRLAEIWAGLLGIAPPGRTESFFALGGHSLLAARLLSRLRQEIGVELPLRALFEAPTIAGLAERIDAAQASAAADTAEPPLLPTGVAEAPLSFAQERLWFLDRLQPGSSLYDIPAVLRLTGDLEVAALRKSFAEIVRRHGSLRTTFAEADGEPRQVIAPPAASADAIDAIALPLLDLSGLPAASRDREAARRTAEEAGSPFDLARGPLLRLRLLRSGRRDHILVANVHHIASDGWSMGILVRESNLLYQAFVQGLPSPLPELPVQYVDFALWQRRRLSGPVLEAQLDFWRRELAGAPTLLALPTDRPRPAVQSYRGATLSFALPAETTAAVRALTRQAEATPFMVLLAAFQVLLLRSSGADDVLVGSPFASRDRPEIEELIGFFVNTLVFRLRLRQEEGEGFLAVLGRVRAAVLAGHAHQDLPFELLVEALGVERSLAHNPLFQVMLVLLNNAAGELRAPGLTFSPLAPPATTAKFDLTLSLLDEAGALSGALEYAIDLFDGTTVRRLIVHLETLLAGAVADPGRRVAEIPLLSAAEQHQLATGWNDTAASYGAACLHELIAAQAARTPDAVAVVFAGDELTYRELDRRAGRLARRLRALGAGPEVLVGIAAQRSLELVVGLLAILKAGSAYVPLDPGYPDERLAFMLADAGVPVLLTQEPLAERLAALSPAGVHQVLLETGETEGEAFDAGTGPDNAAYAIYTSGSTGRPKGAVNSHRAIVNRLLWMVEAYGIGPADRVLQKTPFSFDVSVWEFFAPLLVGARLVVARPDGHRDPAYLVDLIARERVTTLHFVPSMLQVFLEEPALRQPGRLASLRQVMASGEALSPELERRFRDLLGEPLGIELHNLYGPTEAAVDVTAWACGHGEERRTVPIGRPIANLRIHLLPRAGGGELVPIGVPGELHIGGVGLARGYLNRPGLTADRFVPDPLSASPGARLYRTGDLARHLPGGEIEYLGRLDHQVKIRGFRIELGEIEAVLDRHPGVRESRVVVREAASDASDGTGDRQLVAYFLPAGQEMTEPGDPEENALREHLRGHLPEHMLPAAFVAVPAWPLTPNGKLDLKALPAPERRGGDAAAEPPRTATEIRLAEIWAELLRIAVPGRTESFFEVGGHSLLATRLLSRLRDAFGVELPLRNLFETPTLAGLAAQIDTLSPSGAPAKPPLVATGATVAPLSFAQERLWFLDRFQPDSALYTIPAVLRLTGHLDDLDIAALRQSFAEIVRRHGTLRTTFTVLDALDEEPRQVVHPPGPVPLPLVDLSGLPASRRDPEAARRTAEAVGRPFDLAQGPVLRLCLLRHGADDHTLIVNVHHIASDGWSMGVLVRESTVLYRAFAQGLPSPLPELPVQYVDFALWQRQWLAGPVLAAQLDFWRRELAGAPALLALPTDRPRPAVQSFRGATLPFTLPTAATAAVQALARRADATPFMALLAAFQTLLHRFTGQEDLLVGSPIANRGATQVETLIGFFVNTLVLRARPSPEMPFAGLLAAVRATTLAAYAHQDLPFERLVDELAIERSLDRNPLFQVILALQNAPVEPLALPGLSLTPVDLGTGTAKLDLTLVLAEADGALAGGIEYATDLFDAATVRRFTGCFATLLAGITAAPERPLRDLPLLASGELHQVLAEHNDTATGYPRQASIHGLVAAQAALRPAAVALISGPRAEVRLTYRELDRTADRLARRLRALGVGPEVLAGVCLERSPEAVVALLAVLKAGGAFVPLDPSYPAERLAFMMADTAAPVLITDERLRASLPALPGVRIVCLDREDEEIAGRDDGGDLASAGADTAVSPDNLAYVMYTSGSTGRPKGVAVTHRNVVRLVSETNFADLSAGQVFLQLAPLTFDASTLEIWGPLANGGRLAVPAPGRVSLAELAAALELYGVTTLWLTAGLFHQMVEAEPASLLRLSQLLAGGDVLQAPHVRRLLAEPGGPALINGYGPTEGTTFTCCALLRGPGQVRATVPIGRPIANTRVYLLDRSLTPVPPGAPGELLAAGDGLARGYLSRPDLTAERFIPPPAVCGEAPGARVYRTGDLARHLPGGEIEYLGRLDHQVKIRGFRIELGEIEAVLDRHPGVRESRVLLREVASDGMGDRQLVAYFLPADPEMTEPQETGLREHLCEHLPEHMVPAAFVAVPAWPLTPNGKLDRKALPDPERRGGDAAAEPPRTATETRLAEIWAGLLGIAPPGRTESFFALGGHSLLATRLLSRLRQELGVELPLRALFEAPTVAGLAGRIDAAQTSATLAAGGEPPLRPTGAAEAPLSFAQERLWFLDRLQPGSSLYNIPVVLHLTGDLGDRGIAALGMSFAEIVRRHGSLRTTFVEAGGEPRQVIAPPIPAETSSGAIALPLLDLSGLPAESRGREAARRIAEEAGSPFDLARGPLLRLRLLRQDRGDHILVANVHHIASDGWSMGILVRESTLLYQAFVQGLPSPLPELPVQYVDFALWQRRRLSGPGLEAQLDFWRRELAGAPTLLALPTDRPRPAVQSYRGATLALALPAEATAAVRALARQAEATPFMVLLAAFQILLLRSSGADDVLVGSPFASRDRPEIEELIGFFVNTLVFRLRLRQEEGEGFLAVLGRVRAAVLAGHAHQDLPFELLVEALGVERSLAHNPLFQVMLVLLNNPAGELRAPGLTVSPLAPPATTAKFDLTLSLLDEAGALSGALEYATGLFDETTVRRLLVHFETLLAGAAADPARRLAEIPLLSAAERHQLAAGWNDTAVDNGAAACLHELIAAQAARTPDAVAVAFAGDGLTYRELDRRAGRLARHLRALGAGPEVLVGIAAQRSLELVVGLLAILKAGGAYVPLDPGYPDERLAFMLADAGVPVLLTQEPLAERFAALSPAGVRQVLLDAAEPGDGAGDTALDPGTGPDNAAYAIYTSGSTGRPKGAANSHRAIVNRLLWMVEAYGIGPADRVLQKTPFSFDVSVWEFFAPLLAGARLVVARPDGHRDPAYLVDLIAREGVTTAHFVPSMLQVFLEEPALRALRCSGRLGSLRQVMASGEALPPELERRFLDLLGEPPGIELHNLYGPTEAAVDVTAWACGHDGERRTVPIGRPIANLRIHLLPRAGGGEPVPIGVPGELHIGGVGLARGYLNRPGLTAERFVPDALSASPGERLYRTGDLARHLPGGEIEYLGRLDHQVKIRGFRIELGEIEAVLDRHPAVRDAAVVARTDAPSGTVLVAYVVAADAQPSAAELAAALRARLPDYMVPPVPSGWVFLPALPLSPNGKLDRNALPVPERLGSTAGAGEAAAPRTPEEELLAGLWAQLLDLPRVGICDNFFALGGHSLLAARLVARVRDVLGVELPLRALFEAPTVAELAAGLSVARRTAPLPPLVLRPREEEVPLSFAQERLWLIDQLTPGSAAYNIPLAVRLAGDLDPACLARSLTEVARRHETLRTTFRTTGSRPVQVIDPAPVFALPLVDLTLVPAAARQDEAHRLLAAEARRPFDLAHGPVWRALLLSLGERESICETICLVNTHHIASDGWSLGVLIREVGALYTAFSQGLPAPLPPLPVQYADYALWQRDWLQGEVLDGQIAFWRGELAGAPAQLDLPVDRPRPALASLAGAALPVALPAELTAALADLARRQGATLFMMLLAALDALLHRVTGQEDLLVGSPVANRGATQAETLIGFFVNTLVLRARPAPEQPFTGLLAAVKATALAAYTHQDLPFERLVDELAIERKLDRNPLFQVVLALQNAPAEPLALPGLSLTPLDLGTETAKFDLSLVLAEAGGGLAGGMEYATDLFDAATVRRFAGCFATLLGGITAAPERPLRDLPLLAPGELQQVLAEWNDTATGYPRQASIHGLVAAQAALSPAAVALVSGPRAEVRLTYRELDRAANRLARHLRTLGVGPEVLVGVCLERSVEAVVALLAVLKAGGAFVPLDPAFPAERLAFLLADTAAPVLITEERLRESLPDLPGLRVVCLDREDEAIARWDDGDDLAGTGAEAGSEDTAVSPDNLAYVMYTSGSTGRPKGVAVTHRNVVRLVSETNFADLSASQVFLQLAPLSFDASTLEIWGPLANGGRLAVLAPGRVSLAELAAALELYGVTTLWLTAGLFHQMVDAEPASLRRLSQLLAGGDVLQAPHVRRLLAEPGGPALINGYGPTEGTTFTSCSRLGEAEQVRATVPIGRPVANTRVYLLDRSLTPVPPGVPGELLAAGDGLARGYLSRPDLTAERFIPAPAACGEAPGARLYRTGDLARHLPGGEIEYLGRLDQQVKIRGFRIEPGEVEAALGAIPTVANAAVVVRDEGGERRLVAYVVAVPGAPGGEAGARALRGELAGRLPEPMIPSDFVFLDALPLTANGKVDRRALPAPERVGTGHQEAGRLPGRQATPTEEMLVLLWGELLGVSSVGVDDGFFDLGGHSLLATRLASRVRDLFGVEIPLRDVFEAPTPAGLAARIEAARLRRGGPPIPPILPAVGAERFRARPSFAQERLWFLAQLEPDSSFYNVAAALRISGALDPAVLQAAFGAVVRRHDALRTTFPSLAGEPWQVVLPELAIDLPVVDLSALPADRREAEAGRRLREESERPFDLASGPLVRALLIRQNGEEHAAVLTLHHIVSDGWSMDVLLREIAAFAAFAAFAASPTAPPAALPVQYADFARWQRAWLTGEVLAAEIDFWTGALHGARTVLELSADHPRPPVQSFRGAHRPFAVPAPLAAALRGLCRRQGVTLFMALLGAFEALLARSTGEESFLVGSPVANRRRGETEGLIGFFVNNLVLRADLAGDPGFAGLLARVRGTALAAYEHQDLPFERLVEALGVERSLARNPLFQVVFTLQNAPAAPFELPGLTLSPLTLPVTTAKTDLLLTLAETAGDEAGLAGSFEYATDLFDAVRIERMAGHFLALLAAAVAEPSLRLADLPLLTPAERQQLRWEWSPAAAASGTDCLHELFAHQAAAAPDALAVICGDDTATYRELARRAERLARHLAALGVGPETLVGIAAEPSLARVAAVLAVWQAGGAYVPLDASYPRERLAFMLEDAVVRVLLAEERLLAGLPPYRGEVVLLDGPETEPETAGPLPRVTGDNLAYVIYTSGSTGRPNGVLVRHGSAARLIRAAIGHFAVSPESRVLQSVSFSFDASVLETWMALASGAALVIASRAALLSGEALAETVRRHGVTTAVLTPAVLANLSTEGLPALPTLPTLVTASVGGDRCPGELATRWSGRLRLLNCYGPTEATIYASVLRLTGAFAKEPPIGRPVAGAEILILDRTGRQVPAGIPGELCIAGAGLARGYLHRPALTARRFVPHPAPAEPGDRLYRTGDLACHRGDGTLEFLGRLDHQVKVRGVRIELGEVEAVLARHPAVRECAAAVRPAAGGDPQLVAWVVWQDGADATGTDLRAFLRERLPEHMVPAATVILPALPLTPTGKVDRAALPAPEGAGAAGRIAPRDPLEQALALVWEEVLGVGPVGVRDDFFVLGGHSLLAVRLMARIEERLGRALPLTALFTAGTVEGMAALLREADLPQRTSNLIPLQPRGSQPPFFWVHPAGGDVLCYAVLARHLGAEQPFYGIQARGFAGGEEPPARIEPRIEEMAALYIEEVRRVQPGGPYFLAGWSLGSPVAFEMARQLRSLGETIALLAVLDGAPSVEGGGEENDADFLLDIAAYVGNFWGRDPGVSRERLLTLGSDEQIAHLAERLAGVDFLPPGTGEAQLRRVLAVYRANARAARRYQPGFYPGGLTLLRAEERPALPGILGEDDLGWRQVVAGPVEIHSVPGNHLTLLAEPHVQALAARLQLCLEQARAGTMEAFR